MGDRLSETHKNEGLPGVDKFDPKSEEEMTEHLRSILGQNVTEHVIPRPRTPQYGFYTPTEEARKIAEHSDVIHPKGSVPPEGRELPFGD